MAQHVADDIKKTRAEKIIAFTKRVLTRRSAKAHHAVAQAETAPRSAAAN